MPPTDGGPTSPNILALMNDWFRSMAILGTGFAGVVAVTIGLATVIVPASAVSSQGSNSAQHDGSATDHRPAPNDGISGTGGTLTVSGDREGSFILDGPTQGESFFGEAPARYGLEGDDGRIFFTRDPVAVEQMSFDGLSFYPDPDECTIEPGDLGHAPGVGQAELRCDSLEDVRGNGVISIDGIIRLPIDLLVPRELPPSGGSVDVGDETWEFDDATLFIGQEGASGMTLLDMASFVDLNWQPSTLHFTYDPQTDRFKLVMVERSGEAVEVADGACDLAATELGEIHGGTTVLELSIECPEVDVPDLGIISVTGTIIVDRTELVTSH